MGLNQGVKRLSCGIVRRLSRHELARGYVFISLDKHLSKILDTKDFEVEIAGEICPRRRIDSQGRVQIPKRLLKNIGTTEEVHIRLVSRKRLNMETASRGGRRQGGNGTVRT